MKSGSVLTKQQRIAKLAEQMPELAFTSLNHYIDMDWMKEAYRRTKKDKAPGVDGETAENYEKDLEGNLQKLMDRAKSGTYRAPPVKRVYIPKGSGPETRPIGIPTLEDKVLQRVVTMVLEPIYEHDFLDCSYGFRPKRSPHQAIQTIWNQTMRIGGGWIIDADISKYFDTLNHGQLREFLQRRVRDGVIRRLIGKWLKAGVMEEEVLTYPEEGTPQGGVISPILSNIYLHEVLDAWFETWVKPCLRGQAYLIRFADDFVIACQLEEDARRIMEVLPKRFAKYGLTIHPHKTKLVDFRRPRKGRAGPESFDFLGFTHYWGTSRRGRQIVKRKTAKKRLSRSLRGINDWCRKSRHEPVSEQHKALNQKLKGHYGYFGITGNGRSLAGYRHEAGRLWRKWLNRRSRKKAMPWPRFKRLLERWPLAPVRIVQSVYARP
jgi:group II intron reverse transcriptase/maturase